MDRQRLRASAQRLAQVLRTHADDPAARALRDALSGVLAEAMDGNIDQPLAWRAVPGAAMFSDGALAALADLELAYSDFKIELTGGESALLRQLREQAAAQRGPDT